MPTVSYFIHLMQWWGS